METDQAITPTLPTSEITNPLPTLPDPPLAKSNFILYVGVSLIILAIGGLFFLAESKFAKYQQQSKEPALTPSALPTPTPTSIAMPTIAPTATPLVSSKPTLTPKSSSKVSPTPSPSPTPVIIIDNTFTCGSYSIDNYPPLPAYGKTPLLVTLYPSGGTSGGISLSGFEWDFDGDGVWEGGVSASKVGRTYDKYGTYTPKFRARGNNGAFGPTCTYPFQVVAGGTTTFENDIIMIDKLSVETTISKSKNNYTFTGNDAKYNNNTEKIYVPFVIISLKKTNAIITTNENNNNSNFGALQNNYYTDAGSAFTSLLWVNKNIPNGVYTGQLKVETTDSSGINRYFATNVTYRITVID